MRTAFISIKNCVDNCLTQIAGCLRTEATNKKNVPGIVYSAIVTEII